MTETDRVVAHVTIRPNTVAELRALLLDPPEPPQREAGSLRATLPRHPTEPSASKTPPGSEEEAPIQRSQGFGWSGSMPYRTMACWTWVRSTTPSSASALRAATVM